MTRLILCWWRRVFTCGSWVTLRTLTWSLSIGVTVSAEKAAAAKNRNGIVRMRLIIYDVWRKVESGGNWERQLCHSIPVTLQCSKKCDKRSLVLTGDMQPKFVTLHGSHLQAESFESRGYVVLVQPSRIKP